jgi:hypothetical protein
MFAKCSGLKSEALYIGISSNFRHKINSIKWSNGYIKYLGVYLNKNTQIACKYNIKTKFEKIANTIKIWKCRHLTLKGKITILNTLLLSQMLYIASVIHIPEWALVKYKQLITSFIWDNKPAKIKYETIIAPILQGGLNPQNLETKIKANKISWIKNLLQTEKTTPWKSFLQSIVNIPIAEIPHSNIKSIKNINKGKPKQKFYLEMLQIWAQMSYFEPKDTPEMLTQPLWYNELIQVGKKPAIIRSWKKAGISKIYHMINNNGNIITKKH